MRRVMALAICVLWAVPLLAASPDPKDLVIPAQEVARARDLIRRLGSEVYREREEAQSDLAKMGRMARPALLEAASGDPDPEVRFRCSRLLPKAGAEDLKARLDTFLADTESKYEHNLPGLKLYRKVAGTDKLARDLFVEIVKSPYNLDLLQMLDKTSVEAGRAISDRRMIMWGLIAQRNFNGRIQPQQQIPLADIACLLFAEAAIPAKDIPQTNMMWNHISGVQFINQNSSQTAINNGGVAHSEVYKRIVGHWLDTRDDPMDLTNLAFQLNGTLRNLRETGPLFRRIIATEGVAGYAKGNALIQLTTNRGKEEQELLKSCLTKDDVVTVVFFGVNGPNQVPVQLQCLLKDVALAMLIEQNGLQMSDFGFKAINNIVPRAMNYGQYAFPTDEARNAGMVKFAFWEMKKAGKPAAPAKPMDPPAPPVNKKK